PVGLATHTVSKELIWEDRVKQLAKGAGLTELYTYSFVSRELCEKAGYSVDRSLRVQNPLSNDFEFMRTSLLPSILQVVADNQERFREQQLFEVAHVYLPKDKDWRDLPDEQLELSAAFFGGNDVWRKAKGFAELVYQECGIKEVVWKRLVTDPFWHPGRSVQAFHGEHLLGTIGEVHPMIAQKFKLDGRVALINLPLEEAFALATSAKTYIPLPSYPEAKRDMALLVDRAVEVQALAEIMKSASTILHSVEWFDTYVGKGLPADKKSVAFHLVFRLDERTLETSEVDVAMKKIQEHLKKSFGAETR
ncbi:hypothetical protein EXS71_02155, partial [Candidatus Uhrbacteria bacterium]|nr:hypothetical protein [Candidatus Uhrbacteria bacterium]